MDQICSALTLAGRWSSLHGLKARDTASYGVCSNKAVQRRVAGRGCVGGWGRTGEIAGCWGGAAGRGGRWQRQRQRQGKGKRCQSGKMGAARTTTAMGANPTVSGRQDRRDGASSIEQRPIGTNLVVDLLGGVLEVDRLLENGALLVELDALGPVVEGTGHVDFLGRVFPGTAASVLWIRSVLFLERKSVGHGRHRRDGVEDELGGPARGKARRQRTT